MRTYLRTTEERLVAYSDRSRECWIWTGSIQKNGYGKVTGPGKSKLYAHRVSYEHYVGPIPDGMVIDHLCRNRACIRPDHLEAVRHEDNVARGLRGFKLTDTCRSGRHDVSAPGAIVTRANGSRYCRLCDNERQRRDHANARRNSDQ